MYIGSRGRQGAISESRQLLLDGRREIRIETVVNHLLVGGLRKIKVEFWHPIYDSGCRFGDGKNKRRSPAKLRSMFQAKIHRNCGHHLDRGAIQKRRFILPLLDGIHSGLRQLRIDRGVDHGDAQQIALH